jgi:acyl-CoA reductase-like NAD-dependent aldehyde dehydrogenase
MMNPQTFLNWIDGRWVAGETLVENRSPSDTNDLIGCYTQATSAQVHAAIAAAALARLGRHRARKAARRAAGHR